MLGYGNDSIILPVIVCLQQPEARLASLLSTANQLLHHALGFHHSHMILHFLTSESGMFLFGFFCSFFFFLFMFQSKELRQALIPSFPVQFQNVRR